MPRFHCPTPLQTGEVIALPAGAARHVQVLRMQPGGTITLFGGAERGGEFEATIEHMGRSEVRVLVGAHFAVEREPTRQVHLVVGVPANDRMDWLVEKATELGVASIQPVMTERSVLRLSGERAEKKTSPLASCGGCGLRAMWAQPSACGARGADFERLAGVAKRKFRHGTLFVVFAP